MLSFKEFINEALEYHIGIGGFTKILEQKPEMKPLFDILVNDSKHLHFKFEDGVVKNTLIFSIIAQKDFSILEKVYNSVAHLVSNAKIENGKHIDFEYAGTKIRIRMSGGRLKNVFDEQGNNVKETAPSTIQQESALVYILNQTIYPEKEEIENKIGFSFDDSWNESFEKSYNAITYMLGMGTYSFYRDSDKSKPAILNKMMTSKYLPDSKDNWNPSDIWAIHKDSLDIVTSRLLTVLNLMDKKEATIYDLNLELEILFDQGILLGISLKKLDKGVTGSLQKIKVSPHYIQSIKFISVSNKFKFKPNLSYIDLNCVFEILGDQLNYLFRIAPRAASGDLNLYVQGAAGTTQKGHWDGSVSKILMNGKTENRISIFKHKIEHLDLTLNHSVSSALPEIKEPEFTQWVKGVNSKFISISELDKNLSVFEIKRALCLLHFVWEIEKLNIQENLKSFLLSSTKMNEFSSIHYKLS